jgi:predicted peptidase
MLESLREEAHVKLSSVMMAGFVMLSLAVAPRSTARTPQTGFLDRTISVNGATYKYQIFVPEDWSPKQKWPIILFLHGAGERGSDGLLQTDVGLAHAIRMDRSRFKTIVVMPQCLKDGWWRTSQMEEMALATLAAATKEFKGDSKRTYLTGLSMGGYGSWDLAAKYPGKFAAVVPICGGIVIPEHLRQQRPDLAATAYPDEPKSYEEVAKKIGKTPVWIFHGGADEVVPVEGSRKLDAALKAAGGDVRYTEYPGVGHNSWDKAYAEPELMTWMLSQSLK